MYTADSFLQVEAELLREPPSHGSSWETNRVLQQNQNAVVGSGSKGMDLSGAAQTLSIKGRGSERQMCAHCGQLISKKEEWK